MYYRNTSACKVHNIIIMSEFDPQVIHTLHHHDITVSLQEVHIPHNSSSKQANCGSMQLTVRYIESEVNSGTRVH